jgi:regulatory protein NPR1
MAEKASIEDVMRMLARAGKKDDLHLWHLWSLCSKLVAKSGLSTETLQKHLPAEVVLELEAIRRKTGHGFDSQQAMGGSVEQKTKRMQKALDSSDVELVKLMVMGEGLNLDKAFALHYVVNSCSRCNSLILRNQLFLFHLRQRRALFVHNHAIFIHE